MRLKARCTACCSSCRGPCRSYVTALAWKGMFHRQFGAVNALLALRSAPSP